MVASLRVFCVPSASSTTASAASVRTSGALVELVKEDYAAARILVEKVRAARERAMNEVPYLASVR